MIGPCCEIDLNAEVSLGKIWPLPYTGFAGGALKGCASVLNTSAHLSALAAQTRQRQQLTFVEADEARVGEGEVEVLEDLREPEALHVVDERRVRRVDVVDARVRDGRGQVREEGVDRIRGALHVLGVARHAPRVEVGLEHLRAQVVVRVARLDEEPMSLVEREVPVGRRGTSVVAVGREVGKDLWADACAVVNAVDSM